LETSTADDGPGIGVSVSEAKGEVGMNRYQSRCILFIEERTAIDITDDFPVHSHWLGDRRTSHGAGLLDSKFTITLLGAFWLGQVLG
jgi:hypothetical protein